MCECGIVPIVRRLVLKGVPVSCAVAYLLASPVINPLVILSTWVAFLDRGAPLVVALRLGFAYFVAVAVSLAVWWWFGEENVLLSRSQGNQDDHHDAHSRGGLAVNVLVTASQDFLVIGATLVVGAGLAAAINSGFSRAAMEPFADNPWTAVGGMSVMAIALNLCSEADAFVAASFFAFPLSAKLAFLVLGPMVDLKLMAMYTTVFRPKAILFIMGLVTILVFALCIAGYAWIPEFPTM
jgi:uncharacterized membrane protein YraQ (UPF0718 family)